jgi:3-dehydroquinate synthase
MNHTVLPEEIIITDSKNLADNLNLSIYDRVFVLMDENSEKFCLPILDNAGALPASRIDICISQGESNKTLASCENIWDAMMMNHGSRKSCLVALGGGVICDMGGLAASLFKRGIDFFLVPTTLLAQVDAAVGGKTAVNFHHYKNQIGCFSAPKEVIINPDFLATLPRRHMVAGYAEMLKHGILSDQQHFETLIAIQEISAKEIAPFIWPSLQIKAATVQEDPFEEHLRKALNFGHTIGHGLESWSNSRQDNALLHGEAVALGMIAELLIAEELFENPALVREQLERRFTGIISCILEEDNFADILQYIAHDKKNTAEKVKMALPANENIAINVEVDQALIIKALKHLKNFLSK